MRKFYVFVLFLLLLLVVAIGLSPWVDGYLFKRNYLNAIAIINKDTRVHITVLEYHMGWLASDVRISVEPKISQASPREKQMLSEFIIVDHVSHGPLIYNQEQQRLEVAQAALTSEVHFPDLIEAFLLGNKEDHGLVQIYSVASFHGKYLCHVEIPRIVIKNAEMGDVTWEGMKGDITLDFSANHLNEVISNLQVGSFTMDNLQGAIKMQPITIKEDVVRQAMGLWNGSYGFATPSIAVKLATDAYEVKDFSFSSTFAMKNDLYNHQVQLKFSQLLMPIFPVGAATINLAFNNISATGLANANNSIFAEGAQAVTPEELAADSALIAKLITPSTSLQGDVLINAASGRLQVNANAYWPQNIPAPTTTDEIIQKANARVDVRVSIAMVDQLIDLIAKQMELEAAQASPAISSASANDGGSTLLSQFVDQGKVTDFGASQLQELQDSHAAYDVYASTLDKLVTMGDVSAPVAPQLKAQYRSMMPKPVASPLPTSSFHPVAASSLPNSTLKTAAVTQPSGQAAVSSLPASTAIPIAPGSSLSAAMPVAPSTPPSTAIPVAPNVPQIAAIPQISPPTPMTRKQVFQKEIDALIAQGYIIKDNNDYAASLTYENGITKINGKDLGVATK